MGGTTGGGVAQRVGLYTVSAADSYGPRITWCSLGDGPNVLAELDASIRIETPDLRAFVMHGGHRLWVSPEVPGVTYAPDGHECEVTAGPDELLVEAPADRAGFTKSIRVSADGASLRVEHRLRWDGRGLTMVAPWAITQLPLGGTAFMPVAALSNDSRYQADGSLVIWPYTDLTDERLGWLARGIRVAADPGPRFKLGSGPAPGSLGYLRGGHLFMKAFEAVGGSDYPDRGAVGQVFVGDSFAELESLGPLKAMEPGESATHSETWTVLRCSEIDEAEKLMGMV